MGVARSATVLEGSKEKMFVNNKGVKISEDKIN